MFLVRSTGTKPSQSLMGGLRDLWDMMSERIFRELMIRGLDGFLGKQGLDLAWKQMSSQKGLWHA